MEKFELPEEIPSGLVFKLGVTLCSHPLEVAKTLIQLGHEPIAPRSTKTLLGKPALALPSIFQYCGHIRKKEGWTGLWRGITPRLSGIALQSFAAAKFDELVPPEKDLVESEEARLTDEEKRARFLRATLRDISCKIVCVVISQPLQVITVRAMAEFIGGEDKHIGGITGGIYNGLCTILTENGLVGLWSGLVPRMVGEVSLVAIASTTTFLINTYVLHDRELKKYTHQFANFVAQSLTYPFQVVGTCMAVSRSGLAAGYPPCMPFYSDWTDCFAHLRSQKQLKRGSSMFFRYYTGPQIMVGEKLMPASSLLFKSAKH